MPNHPQQDLLDAIKSRKERNQNVTLKQAPPTPQVSPAVLEAQASRIISAHAHDKVAEAVASKGRVLSYHRRTAMAKGQRRGEWAGWGVTVAEHLTPRKKPSNVRRSAK
jgi:hypothetical protein